MSNHGYLVISLDFELYWGMFDKVTLLQYGDHINGEQTAIPKMLALFSDNGIHVTWATVGMLMCENKNALLNSLPNGRLQPVYPDMKVSSYEHIKKHPLGNDAQNDPYHYGSHLLKRILTVPHQELGSHTFSHYYCIDGNKNGKAIFVADCEAFSKSAIPFNQIVTSIVFPRNQTTEDALGVCKDFGFTAYRGTPSHFLYTGKKESAQTNIFLRALRLIDTYMNISGHHTFDFSTVNSTKIPQLKNVQGSWFLRPYNKALRMFEGLKLRRIKNSMTYAAKHNEIFHLWWHPHNFGIQQKENLQNLQELLEHFNTLQTKYNMRSANMKDIVRHLSEQNV